MKLSPPPPTTTTAASLSTQSSTPLLSSTSSSSPVAQALLNDKTYDIEFHGYLSNHVKHAIIALDKLRAPDQRIQGYWNEYTTVTPYDIVLDKVEKTFSDPSLRATTKEEWITNRGKKVQWQEMVKFLEQQQVTSNLDIDTLVKMYAPDLLPGSAGALTHGIIHLGWAIDAGNPWMTLEGLAYLNFCNLPIGQPLQYQPLDEEEEYDVMDVDQSYIDIAMKSVVDVATEYHTKNLQETWIETTKSKYDETFHPELVSAGFQWHFAKVLHDAHPISTTIPTWIKSNNDDNGENKQILSIDKVWESMYYIMTIIYLSTRTAAIADAAAAIATDKNLVDTEECNGNFVVLHLLTSLWGLEKTCEVIGDDAVSRVALAHFWTIAVCLLSTSTTGFPTPQQLKDTIEKYPYYNHVPTGNVSTTTSDNVVPLVDWTTTVERGIAEREEHNIKLVYVTQELYRRYKNHWFGYAEAGKSFTLTPNIRPTKPKFDA